MAQSWKLDRSRRAIEQLSRAGLDLHSFCSEVAGHLGATVGFDGWCVTNTDPVSLTPAKAAERNSPAAAPQQRFWQIEFQVPDVNKFVALASSARPAQALSAATGGDLARSRRWDEILRPAGAGDELRAALVADGLCWGSVSLYRDSAAAAYKTDEVQYVTELLTAVAAGARGAWTATAVSTGSAAKATEPPGTLIVTADGTQVASTPAASSWLARLHPNPRVTGSLIYALVARLATSRPPASGTEAGVSVRTQTTDRQWLDMHAAPLHGGAPGHDVVITLAAANPARISSLMMRAYTLSARERQVASLLLDGRSPAEIARDLHLSLHTVKDHMRAVFRKTRSHSRPQLTSRLTGQSS